MSPKPMRSLPNRPDKIENTHSAALLLVERDDGLRRFLFWALYLEGFKVLTGRDAQDGLRLSRDVAGPIEVLIIGSLPPGSYPAEMRRQIESERPEIRTIFLEDLESSNESANPRLSDEGQSNAEDGISADALIRRIKGMVGR